MASTNYFATLIEVADDCPVAAGEAPPPKGDEKSVAILTYELLVGRPYEFTSDDVLFSVYASRQGIAEEASAGERERFFSKGQPCFRASPLTKRYGWGVHSNEEGKIALYSVDSEEYRGFVADASVTKKKALRSQRAR